jgi:hypothetical protein
VGKKSTVQSQSFSSPKPFFEFMRVDLDNTVGLQFLEREGESEMQHDTFLMAESDFDAFFARLVQLNFKTSLLELLLLCDPVVLLQNLLQSIVRQGDHHMTVHTRHRFCGDQGIYDGFFGSLHRS